MYQFDAFTIHSILFIGNIFTILFLLTYRIIHPQQNDKLLIYILAKFLQSVMWLIYMFDSTRAVQFTLSRIISDSSHVFGIVLELYCLISLAKTDSKKLLSTLLSISALFTLSIIIVNTELFEIVTISYTVGGILLLTWYEMAIKKNTSKMRRVVGWLSFSIAIIQFARGSAFFSQSYIQSIKNDIDPLYYYLAVALLIITFTYPLLFMVLQKENDALLIQEIDKKLSDQNKELIRLNATKDRFFSIISHDLRGPIGSLNNLLSLMQTDPRIQSQVDLNKIFNLISDSSQKSFVLLDNLLNWSRIQREETSIKPERFLLKSQVEDILKLFHPNFHTKSISVEMDVDHKLQVFTDQFMLETIIRNLLSNAIKFTPDHGRIKIVACQQKSNIEISIIDSGIGLKSEAIDQLFQLEFTKTTPGTRKEKGTGLGLILCAEFANSMGGQISVESQIGKGSTFRFTFPDAPPEIFVAAD
ncbi:MAG: sensor histidine kinase [Prolixibacteraceae bacterium]